jgi:uncharacterized coiled-coil protein SlyX
MSSKKPSIATKTSGAASRARPEAPVAAEPSAVEPAARSLDEIAERLREQEAETSPARRAAQAKHEQEVLESAATVTAETAVRAVGDLKVTIDSTLDQLSQQLVDQAKKLTAVQEAVAVRRRQLAELYDIEVVAETLAALIRDYEQKQTQFADEADKRKAEFERDMLDARVAWDKEKQRAQEESTAEKARAKKEWQREQEEYQYTLKTQRARDEEAYAKRREALDAQLTEDRVKQEKALAEREAAVAAREKELADLQARVQALDGEMQRAVAQAREEATKAAEERARQSAALKGKDFEGTEKLQQQRIQTLEALVAEKNARIEELQTELRDASVKVRDIAVKAIEGASGAAALTHVSGIALQQAKGRDDRG